MKLHDLKKSFILNASLFIAMALVMNTANSETITFEFEGVVTNVNQKIRRDNKSVSYIPALRDSKAFSPGDKFSGTYTFDSNTTGRNTRRGFTYSGAISSMSFTSNNTVMATATGGDILIDHLMTSNSSRYKVNFSRMNGRKIRYRPDPNMNFNNNTFYTPTKMELFWIRPEASGTQLEKPYFDSNKDLIDNNDWPLPAPNYGDIRLTYSQVSGPTRAEMTGRLYSVKRVKNLQLPPIDICTIRNLPKNLCSDPIILLP
jgi:hypothetical protein